MSGMNEQSKLAQLEDMTGSSFGQHFSFCKVLLYSSPPVNLPATIYLESPCPSAPSSVIKPCQDNADGESKDCDLLASNHCSCCYNRGHVIPSFSVAALMDMEFYVEDAINKAGLFLHSQPPVLTCSWLLMLLISFLIPLLW